MARKDTNSSKSVLLIDESMVLYKTLREQLEFNLEFVVEFIELRPTEQVCWEFKEYDVILLNVNFSHFEFNNLCSLIRKNTRRIPFIIISNSERTMVEKLKIDADEYVSKPFRISTLLSLMRALILDKKFNNGSELKVGPYSFFPNAKLLINKVSRQEIRLTEKETAILKYLYNTNGKVVTRKSLLTEIWGYKSGVSTHTLETHIYRLRQKIRQESSEVSLLITESGGYRLNLN